MDGAANTKSFIGGRQQAHSFVDKIFNALGEHAQISLLADTTEDDPKKSGKALANERAKQGHGPPLEEMITVPKVRDGANSHGAQFGGGGRTSGGFHEHSNNGGRRSGNNAQGGYRGGSGGGYRNGHSRGNFHGSQQGRGRGGGSGGGYRGGHSRGNFRGGQQGRGRGGGQGGQRRDDRDEEHWQIPDFSGNYDRAYIASILDG
ncbi:hypothetical protein QBC37DRAFT_381101 [Rhypophila decipiens]|uniref:Uncharacterized protein n=1 Tax=Rhypophila decipiens TaxID=261697 RepID=A0AAN6XTI6_9PEZI|nr:hypothetical protein QBC37DRAFT_381101 [Rhypophila decipiens]